MRFNNFLGDTVDGRNPAPPNMYESLKIKNCIFTMSTGAGFRPSTVAYPMIIRLYPLIVKRLELKFRHRQCQTSETSIFVKVTQGFKLYIYIYICI